MTDSTGAGNPASYDKVGHPEKTLSGAQWWLVYAVLVANKSAEQTTPKLLRLLDELLPIRYGLPFEQVKEAAKRGELETHLRTARTGQYARITRSLKAITDIWPNDPREWPLSTLEGIPGIGPKTSRWFYLLAHPAAKVAALDTHVLKFLADQGVQGVPKSTPSKGEKYLALEAEFLKIAERLGLPPRDLDYMVWSVYKNKGRILF